MAEEKSLEQRLKEELLSLKPIADRINDQKLSAEFKERIARLEKQIATVYALSRENAKGVLRKAPENLTRDYTLIEKKVIESDIYTTDDSTPVSALFRLIPLEENKKPWVIVETQTTFTGEGADYIKRSLVKRVAEHAAVCGADLVIYDFVKSSPYKFTIEQVSGLGKYDFQGKIKVRFYKIRGRT